MIDHSTHGCNNILNIKGDKRFRDCKIFRNTYLEITKYKLNKNIHINIQRDAVGYNCNRKNSRIKKNHISTSKKSVNISMNCRVVYL